ncbi:MAG: class II fructose-bisphosphate aldolase [Hespellia sp.]|jgi:fructose-bisphosphate aldolase class II|nr:class II fructose-bisphosphate aldolase [Hespellia sp.]
MLVSMKEILVRASKENYAVPAPNVMSEMDARAMLEAAEEMNAPIIIDVGYSANPDILMFGSYLTKLCEDASVPVAINLDHGGAFAEAIMAIKAGFTSIMVDRSTLPYEENVKEVKELVKVAHSIGVSVEAELGHVGQGEQYDVDRDAALTDPAQAKQYIEDTGIDCLAVAIGTAHGAYVGTPYLDFDRLAEIKKVVGADFPLVLHGGSGTGEEALGKVSKMGINKINIANDLFKAATIGIEEAKLSGNGYYTVYDVAKQSEKDTIKKYLEIFGTKGKAWKVERAAKKAVETTNIEK